MATKDKYKIAICDDSEKDREYIENLVQKWISGSDGSLAAETTLFSSAEEFMFRYEDCKDYDIILLDVEMGKMDGVTMAKKLRAENSRIQIVFITGYSDYIAEGYEVEALHYLMKPVKEEKLFAVLDRATQKVSQNEKTIAVETSDGMAIVPVYQIRYIDVRANYITIHADREYTIKKTLGDIEKELDERFFRVGRSAIVNLSCITRVTKTDIILKDGANIPLPRGAYEKVNRAIISMN
ncbi:LytTR family DNA-binding domain-containing protein [Butyrivibrio sp. DSM 10294]|uniref:LytR/AlgR family response regulator transcription factor n=1 Tax=Butyrivibrio sp. DSM 10294 TaxID=2972457 RepID=UPI00234EC4A5|nr:LytTR family DNA-binding domain-containing protein [Butyrivibrio sp. DSM 10294]MDC7292786.1 LytTR family DNA-binding domain-containing protein [Butyrivibrio sp. DSM 10294]